MDLSGVAQYPQIEEMLDDPRIDMVDICLPPSMHAPVAIAALKAGKAVFVESGRVQLEGNDEIDIPDGDASRVKPTRLRSLRVRRG